jgi:polysaccharide deacetylase family protein (PEP-CTERM system associated)
VKLTHALTIDVEDWFQVLNLRERYPLECWDQCELRLEKPMEVLWELLDQYQAKATFFFLGWIAERLPGLVRETAVRGHEIASHGYDHKLLVELGEEGFDQDLAKTETILKGITGELPRAFRACTWSVGPKTPWAFPTLLKRGYLRDSSVHPIRHPDYGVEDAPLGPYFIEREGGRLFELPPLVTTIWGRRFPLGGGGYLRFFPVRWISKALRNREGDKLPSCIYLHPWELDPGQPRESGLGIRGFRHYVHLSKTRDKLAYLLDRHSFGSFQEVHHEWLQR